MRKNDLLLLILFLAISIFSYCYITSDIEEDNSYNNKKQEYEREKFQDKMSMDFDFFDTYYLLKIAEFFGGNIQDRIYTILVTLNISYETKESIGKIVLDELYNVYGITEYEFENITPSKLSEEALDSVMKKKIDNSNGSIKYKQRNE